MQITHNRIIANAGTNLAGGIGLFAGSDNYDVSYNDICGNFSAEYGGGLSVYGLSPNGAIHHNRVYYNDSYDEGAGIMIAGQLPVNPSGLSPGSGAVDIHDNVILGNLASDDGGGLRFLMAGNAPMNVYNNMITDNVSAHEGGGIALDDATNVRIYHNTIAENLTTATAVTSNGSPAPAGLSTAANSAALQASLPASAAHFSNPVLFNNIFWNNRAGTFNAATATISGIGLGGSRRHRPLGHGSPGSVRFAVADQLGAADHHPHGLDRESDELVREPQLREPLRGVGDRQPVAAVPGLRWRVHRRRRPAAVAAR